MLVIHPLNLRFWALQRWLMYFPTAHLPTPAEIGLTPVEPVTFETADGLKLSGWFLAASGPLPRLTVLVFNGNAGNRGYRGPLAAALHRHGLQVLLFARISDFAMVPYGQDTSARLDFRGSDARNPATEGDPLWVNYSTRRCSSRSMAF